jgi:poly(3-hydroxybutyrate) depolymerase
VGPRSPSPSCTTAPGATSRPPKSFGLQGAPGAAASAIFVFPRGIPYQTYGVGWDDSCGGYDVVFFDHMLAALVADYCIDTARVFVAGFSWGCDHVTALACCRGDRIRGVGAASCSDEFKTASDPGSYLNLPCPVKNEAAIRFTHAEGGDPAYASPLFATTSALYRSFDACSSTTTPVSPSPCAAFVGCAHPLVECAYPGLGHALPPGWATDTWSFFSSL